MSVVQPRRDPGPLPPGVGTDWWLAEARRAYAKQDAITAEELDVAVGEILGGGRPSHPRLQLLVPLASQTEVVSP